MVEAIHFLWVAWRVYRGAKAGSGSYYGAYTRNGVPTITVFVGLGREAWRISVRAGEEFR